MAIMASGWGTVDEFAQEGTNDLWAHEKTAVSGWPTAVVNVLLSQIGRL